MKPALDSQGNIHLIFYNQNTKINYYMQIAFDSSKPVIKALHQTFSQIYTSKWLHDPSQPFHSFSAGRYKDYPWGFLMSSI